MRRDADAVRDDLQSYVVEQLGDPNAILVLDETEFLEKAANSAGVALRCSTTVRRVENSQMGAVLGDEHARGKLYAGIAPIRFCAREAQ